MLAPLAGLAALFPLIGTPSRLSNRFSETPPGLTLDGLAFMRHATFSYEGKDIDLRPDAEAIAWLNEHMRGTPIVAQSSLWFYRTYGIRVAANTGLPTVISALHTNEQRDPALTGMRDSDLNTLYSTTDSEVKLRLLANYRVDYLYVGSVERALYPPEGIAKFATMEDQFLDTVYAAPGATIYRVLDIPYQYRQPAPFDFAARDAEPTPERAVPYDTPESIKALEEEVLEFPENAGAGFDLAQYYMKEGRASDAARVLEAAAEHNPDDVALHQFLGDVLVQLGRYADAEKAYQHAAQIAPTSANWNKLGSELLKQGSLDKAEIALIRAISIAPVDPAAHYNLGRIYAMRGDDAQAAKQVSLYLELAPDGLFVDDARRLLETLEAVNDGS